MYELGKAGMPGLEPGIRGSKAGLAVQVDMRSSYIREFMDFMKYATS